jgi:hypothetical protein
MEACPFQTSGMLQLSLYFPNPSIIKHLEAIWVSGDTAVRSPSETWVGYVDPCVDQAIVFVTIYRSMVQVFIAFLV